MNNLSQFIKNTHKYLCGNQHDIIHIGYGIDENYARCCATSITSFCINNAKRNFTFHIMAKNLSMITKNKFQQLAKTYHVNINIYEIDTKQLNRLPTQTHLPIATYFRFILPLILKDINKLYYIDADIICLQNATNLFSIDLGNNIIGAVPDLPWMNKKRNHALSLKKHIYFNAGMLIINIPKWNNFNVFDKVLSAIQSDPKKFRYLDQDALNLILTGHIQYINSIFNCIDISSVNKKNIILLHFAAHPKPWSIAFPISKICTDFNKNLYKYYEDQTPWKKTPLDKPRNYKEYKVYAKALNHNKQYLKSFYWHLKYLLAKL